MGKRNSHSGKRNSARQRDIDGDCLSGCQHCTENSPVTQHLKPSDDSLQKQRYKPCSWYSHCVSLVVEMDLSQEAQVPGALVTPPKAYFSSHSHQVGNFPSGDSGPIQHPPTPPLGQMSMALQPCINGKAAFSPREMSVHVNLCAPHSMAQIGSAAILALSRPKHQHRSRDIQGHHHGHVTHSRLFLSQGMLSLL